MIGAAIDWGNVPGWVALLVPAAVLVVTVRTYRNVRAQPRRVWVVARTWTYGPPPKPPENNTVEIAIINDSDEPIAEVSPSLHAWRWTRKSVRSTKKVREGGSLIVSRKFPTIQPRTTTDPHELHGVPWPARMMVWSSQTPQLALRFRDGQGRWWVRYPNGRLRWDWRRAFESRWDRRWPPWRRMRVGKS